jgi:hypothetical protein
MRTKTLLLTAAVGMVGVATSLAQVYSVNAVGYVNITIPTGGAFALIANPLNGTNNDWNTVLPLPDDAVGTVAYRWLPEAGAAGGLSDAITYLGTAAGWFDSLGGSPAPLNPGEAIYIQALSGSGSPSLAITFVGDVPQGTLATPLGGSGKYTPKGSVVPQSAPAGAPGVAGTLELPCEVGDLIYLFGPNPTKPTPGFSEAYTYIGEGQWFEPDGSVGSGPVIPVGFGFWFQQVSGTATSWTRTFSVN